MANPNIVNVTDIYGNNSTTVLTGSAQSVINNAAASGKVYKVNSIVATNTEGTNAVDVTVNIYSQDDIGGTAFAIASTISVPADAALIVTDKSTGFYLKEDQSVGALCSASGSMVLTCSWEEIN